MERIRHSLKASSYYWEFLKRFGAECLASWKKEVAGAFVVTLITYFLTRRQKDAWEMASAALEANLIWFSVFVIVHLVHTPYILHRERLHPEAGGQRIVNWMFGLFGAAVLLVIVVAASYRFVKPWAFQLANVTIVAPPPPVIAPPPSQNAADSSGGANSGTAAQATRSQSKLPVVVAQPPVQLTPPPSAQSNPAAIPQTQLDRLIQTDRNLTAGDRDRLSDAIFEYAKFLDSGMDLGYKVNSEFGKISQDRSNGSIAKNFDDHIKILQDIGASGLIYSKSFTQIRDKWKYYPEQTDYIFGDSPDNMGPNTLINTAQGFANYLGTWSKIVNKDQQDMLNLVAIQQNDYTESLTRFFHWVQGCQQRLNQVKQSLQPNGVIQPSQSPTPAPAVAGFL